MYDRLIHTQYKTAPAKWHHIKSRIRYRMMDSKEHEAEIKCGGEYSGRILHCQKVSQKRGSSIQTFNIKNVPLSDLAVIVIIKISPRPT